MRVMVMAGMMMARVMVMVVAAGKRGYRHHDQGDEQEWQKLFHGPDYRHANSTCSFI
jgi:hypothetical protein